MTGIATTYCGKTMILLVMEVVRSAISRLHGADLGNDSGPYDHSLQYRMLSVEEYIHSSDRS